MTDVDWGDYVGSNGADNEKKARRLIDLGVLSTEESGNWIIFSRKDIMLLNPTIKEVVGLYFTSEEYAKGYVAMKYKKSHKEVQIYRLCNGKGGCH